jgi:hypothetical protein
VANALQVSVVAVKTLIRRLRKQFTCLLREKVVRTVSDWQRSMRKSMLFAKPESQPKGS